MRETGLEPVRAAPHAPQTCASADSATLAYLILQLRKVCVCVTLAVPKIRCSHTASPNFDRYAISHSLFRPTDAVVFNAADSATLAYSLHSLECLYNISLLFGIVKAFSEVFSAFLSEKRTVAFHSGSPWISVVGIIRR